MEPGQRREVKEKEERRRVRFEACQAHHSEKEKKKRPPLQAALFKGECAFAAIVLLISAEFLGEFQALKPNVIPTAAAQTLYQSVLRF